MNLRQVAVSFPLAKSATLPDGEAIIDAFHGWIREHAHGRGPLAELLPIDVVDYRHVPDGPGILLVANEGYYSLGEDGFRFAARRDDEGPAGEKITESLARLQAAADELEAALPISLDRRKVEVSVGDRRLAPTREALAEVVGQVISASLADAVVQPSAVDSRGLPTAIAQIS